jgi:hypothetical protein
MKSIGELDNDNPDIPGHGQQHFPEIDNLLFGETSEFQSGHLGKAIDHFGDIVAKFPLDFNGRRIGVLYNVMQQSRRNGIGIHMMLGENKSHVQTMFHEGVARFAILSCVGTI